MEALLSAFMAAALAELGDKTQWLAFALAVHFRRNGAVLAGIAAAAIANAAIAAAGGILVAPMLNRHAATLLLALALVFAGVGAFLPQKRPAVGGWKLGAFGTSLAAFFVLELGDKTQFLTFAIAARSPMPVLAASGAAAGVIAAGAAALTGSAFERLPLKGMRRGVGVLLTLLGLIAAVSALRLI